MSQIEPPFADISGYATALASLVKDRRSPRTDVAFVNDALSRYSEFRPAVEAVEVGDGSTTEWKIGDAPFTTWSDGFSENALIEVERLAAGAPQDPPDVVRTNQYRLEWRTVSGSPALYLMFIDAPSASPNQNRVRFQRKWTVDASTNEVRAHHQMGVVYLACSLKCEALQAVYADTRVDATDLFAGSPKVEEYRELAKTFWYRAKQILGLGKKGGFQHGQIRTGRGRVFNRGYAV